MRLRKAPNHALDRTAGAHSLSAAGQRERSAHTERASRMEGAIVAVTRKTRTAEGVRPPAILKHLVGLVLLGVAFTTEAAPS